jgi:hypothetical protein
MDAALLLAALRSREMNARNPVTLPLAMLSPGAGWVDGYPAQARFSSLKSNLHQLDAALTYVGACLNPVLNGTISSGRLGPHTLNWK